MVEQAPLGSSWTRAVLAFPGVVLGTVRTFECSRAKAAVEMLR